MLHGELHDSCKEFFVGCKTKSHSGSVGNMWLDTYYMRSSMLPTFLSPILAERALVIGKSINFIRLCIQRSPKGAVLSELKAQIKTRTKQGQGGLLPGMPRPSVASALGFGRDRAVKETTVNREDSDDSDIDDNNDATVMGSTVAYAEVEASLRALRYGSVDSYPDPQEEGGGGRGHQGDRGSSEGDSGLKLMELITKISAATDSRLLLLMEKRFQLSVHLLALKKFMLLGQGDFVTCLMDSVGPELKKRANQLYRSMCLM